MQPSGGGGQIRISLPHPIFLAALLTASHLLCLSQRSKTCFRDHKMCCGLMTTRNELRSYSTQMYIIAFLAFGVWGPRMVELI